jgi:hypothetical protein
MAYALSTQESERVLSPWKLAEMLGKAMLTMKRSREERNTPVSTIRAVRTGRLPLSVPAESAVAVSSFTKPTVQDKSFIKQLTAEKYGILAGC